MAKTKKKSAAKVAKKKPAAKARPKSKVGAKSNKAKPATKKKIVKKVTKKKVVVKKSVAKKPAAKKKVVAKVVKRKNAAKSKTAGKPRPKAGVTSAAKKAKAQQVKTKPESIKKVVSPKAVPSKPAREEIKHPAPSLAQMNMFQMPNQRPIAHKPAKTVTNDTRTRYSEEELKEFEKLIFDKLEKAREEYKILKETLNRNNDEGTDATSGGNTKVLEDGAETAEKENLSQLAARQQKYITNLENALVRIKNGTYGICSVTGKLIGKERLIAVPHTTQSIEAKMMKQD
jgi:RNA polymerase-binding transcription factor DksA